MKLRNFWRAPIISEFSFLVAALCVGFAANIVAQIPTPAPSPSQPPPDYDLRWGVKIPMRDKVELNATRYLPKTDGLPSKTPVIFTLTPYISDTYHARAAYFASHGYTFALVDVRGRGNSAGEFEPFANEARDGHDVVEWLAQQPFCDGKVAMWGGSYAGFDQWATAKELPPHLATIVPAAAAHPPLDYPSYNNVGETYDMQWFTLTSSRAGQQNLFADQKFWRTQFLDAYKKHIAFKALDSFVGNPSVNFQRILKHPTADAYYDAMVPSAGQYKKMTLALFTITGQYDDDELGALTFYRDHLANASPEARAKHFLIIGPWDHAGTRTPTDEVGGVKFGAGSIVDLNDLHRQWYDWTIKAGPKPAFLKNQVAYYLLAPGNSGANGEWKYADSLETLTANPRTFYLDSKNGDANGLFRSGSLSENHPGGGTDKFNYDPLDTHCGENVEGIDPKEKTAGIDQTYALSIGNDGLVYHTEPLSSETPLVGCPELTLWVSIDTPDTDLQADLYEIQPDGTSAPSQAESLDKLADDFWTWRAKHAPFTGDDVNRIERPGGMRDWSRASIDQRRKDLEQFEARLKKLDPTAWRIPQQVDYKLIGSALSRVRWELDINPRWKRDPIFYIEQTLTALTETLTVPAPYDNVHSREILTRIENVPSILHQGSDNLEKAPAPFATVAINNLDGIRERLRKMASSLVASTALNPEKLNSACERAADALEKFQQQLREKLPKLPQQTALGRDAYVWFLSNVALMPFTPEELLAMGKQEWNRAVAFETFEKNRNKGVPPLKIAADINSWIKDAARKELQIRKFLEERGILTVPNWVQHYTFRPTPEYLRVPGFAEADDFTGPSRLTENCIRYVPEPSDKLGYFWRATAMDPRPITVHEGIPGHYFQLCLSWKHENPIRRHYYDSGANEGIGFYAEEMMLQAGLFDDSPHTREIIYNFMRLRALRVEVDVKLALGEFTLEQAAKYLQEKVPMDEQTARQEAIAFSTGPGQAITYQIGKLQIMKFLAEARMQQGDKFNLRVFHDFVWKNGNVPIALLRWEYLGREDQLPPLR